jgi:hypothetical protein
LRRTEPTSTSIHCSRLLRRRSSRLGGKGRQQQAEAAEEAEEEEEAQAAEEAEARRLLVRKWRWLSNARNGVGPRTMTSWSLLL